MALGTEGIGVRIETASKQAVQRDAAASTRSRVPVLIAGATVGLAAAEQESADGGRIRRTLRIAGFRVSAAAAQFETLIELCAAEPPDALVVAGEHELLTSAARLREMRARVAPIPMVVVIASTDRRSLRKAMAAGVEGCVRDDDVEEVLALTVAAVTVGQLCVPASMRHPVTRPAFSHREKQVLKLVAQGLTNGEVAERLYLAESTVKSHLSSSFRKLGVNSRQEAAAVVLDPEHGIAAQLVSQTSTTDGAAGTAAAESNGSNPATG